MILNKKIKIVDMTRGPIMKQIILFGLPILLGSIFQQMYNIVDSVVVGNYVGTDALAAVGSASTIAMCVVSITIGLTNGASMVVAQLLGAQRYNDIKKALSTIMYFSAAVSIVVGIIGIVFAVPIMNLLNVPDELMTDSVMYLRIYCAGSLFLMLYNYYMANLRALGDSVTPLLFLIVATLVNVAGDLFFVLKLNMGVEGVAAATVIAQMVSAVLCLIYCTVKNKYFRFGKGEFRFYKEISRDVIRMSIPSALQFAIANISFVAVQGLINSFGTVYMSAYASTHKIEALSHLPIECFSQSLAVFAGQNIGAGNIKRVKQGLLRVAVTLCSICVILGCIVYFFGPQLIILFVGKEAEQIVDIGARFMRIWAPPTAIFGLMNCFNAVLRGAGDSMFVMLSSFSDIGVRMIMSYLLALTFGVGYYGIAYAILCGWLASLLETSIRYFTGKWKYKAIHGAKEGDV